MKHVSVLYIIQRMQYSADPKLVASTVIHSFFNGIHTQQTFSNFTPLAIWVNQTTFRETWSLSPPVLIIRIIFLGKLKMQN